MLTTWRCIPRLPLVLELQCSFCKAPGECQKASQKTEQVLTSHIPCLSCCASGRDLLHLPRPWQVFFCPPLYLSESRNNSPISKAAHMKMVQHSLASCYISNVFRLLMLAVWLLHWNCLILSSVEQTVFFLLGLWTKQSPAGTYETSTFASPLLG